MMMIMFVIIIIIIISIIINNNNDNNNKHDDDNVCGQMLKVQVTSVLPGPGALNQCMHTIPEKSVGLLWIWDMLCCVFGYGI